MRKLSTPHKSSPKRKRKAKIEHPSIDEAIKTIDAIKPPTPEAAKVLALLRSWLTDESGYDEETWPALKRAPDAERDRVGARRLFND